MNKGFKFIIWTLSFMLFIQMVIPTSNVKAFVEESAMNEEKKVFLESVDTNTDIDILEVEQEFNEQFGEEIADEIVFNEVNETDEGIELDLGLESLDDDFHATVMFDSEASEFTASGEAIDENGKLNYYNYQVIVEESTEDSFVATFIDLNTEEVHRFDSNVAEASVLPAIIIGYVVRLGIQYVIKHVAKKHLTNAVKGLSNSIAKKSASKGSTGRQVAKNLEEQLAMKSVISNPLSGAKEVVSKAKMKDKRWLGSKGWAKYQRTFKVAKGKIVNIHFNYNTKTKKFDDFKFK